MDEPEDTFDNFEIRRIVEAADKFMRDENTSPKLRRQVFGFIQDLQVECQQVDQHGREDLSFTLLAVARAAFALGAIAGTPSMVTSFRGGKHSAGGLASAKTRGRSAETWKAHATDLMLTIRSVRPEASQETVAIETTETWKLDEVKAPGFSALVKHLRMLERSGILRRQRKD